MAALRLVLKSNKTDPAGVKGDESTFLKDDAEDALSAAAAIWHMQSLKRHQLKVWRRLRQNLLKKTGERYLWRNLRGY